jgi:hypothetical protein
LPFMYFHLFSRQASFFFSIAWRMSSKIVNLSSHWKLMAFLCSSFRLSSAVFQRFSAVLIDHRQISASYLWFGMTYWMLGLYSHAERA